MSSQLEFTAVFEIVEDGWVQARLVEIPGVITAAPTRDEAKEMLVDALAEYLMSFATPGDGGDTGGSPVNVVITAA